MDINKPITNLKLVEILDEIKNNYSHQKEAEFFKELVCTKFLVPITSDSLTECSSGETILKENVTIKFVAINDSEGNVYLPVFTDWEEIKKWNSEDNVKTLILTFQDCKTIAMGEDNEHKGFVLNPFGQNIVFGENLIQQVGQENVESEKEETVMLGVPEQYPVQMVADIKKNLLYMPSVKSAYLLLMIRDENDKSYLLIVDSSDEHNIIFEKIGDIAMKYLGEEEKLDFVPLSSEFGRSAIEGHTPFYERKQN